VRHSQPTAMVERYQTHTPGELIQLTVLLTSTSDGTRRWRPGIAAAAARRRGTCGLRPAARRAPAAWCAAAPPGRGGGGKGAALPGACAAAGRAASSGRRGCRACGGRGSPCQRQHARRRRPDAREPRRRAAAARAPCGTGPRAACRAAHARTQGAPPAPRARPLARPCARPRSPRRPWARPAAPCPPAPVRRRAGAAGGDPPQRGTGGARGCLAWPKTSWKSVPQIQGPSRREGAAAAVLGLGRSVCVRVAVLEAFRSEVWTRRCGRAALRGPGGSRGQGKRPREPSSTSPGVSPGPLPN
jgi:hypothetical protein